MTKVTRLSILSVPVFTLTLLSTIMAAAQGPGNVISREPKPGGLPPLGLGDLNNCISQLPTPTSACDQVCATQQKCTLICTYRVNSEGQCVPKALCGDCAEIPPDDLPMDPDGGGDTR